MDEIKCLSNSPGRVAILERLDETDGTLEARELEARLDCSRTTLHRNLSELEDRGWVTDEPSGYEITTTGSRVREAFTTCRERIEAIQRMAPFYERVDSPPDADVATMGELRTTTPNQERPYAPVKRLFEMFADAGDVRGCVPAIPSILVDRFRDATEGPTEHTHVLSQSAFETLCGETVNDGELGDVVEQFEITVYTDQVPYGLFLIDQRLVLAAYNDVNQLAVLVETTGRSAFEWGSEEFETYRRQSVPPDAVSVGH